MGDLACKQTDSGNVCADDDGGGAEDAAADEDDDNGGGLNNTGEDDTGGQHSGVVCVGGQQDVCKGCIHEEGTGAMQ